MRFSWLLIGFLIYEGQIMGEFVPGEIGYSEIGLLMGGGGEKGETLEPELREISNNNYT